MKQDFGNYLGLVVNTEDPEKRGRVQVFIPGMMPTLYGDWDQTKKNISFKTFESETFSAGLNIKLKSLLPWAEAAIPFWGGSTGAPINESTGAPTPMPTDQGFNYIYPEEGAGGGGISQQHYGDRKGELGLELQGVIARGLAGTGLNWVSTSGTGYTEKQADGSLHLSGKATDGHFTESVHPYRILDPTTSEEDKGRIAYALSKLTQAGIGGIGYGPGYMGGTTKFHLDIGSYGNWGRDYTYKTQTPWVVNARSGNPQNPPRSNEPPPEAYADTREVSTGGLASTTAEFPGETIRISNNSIGLNGYSENLLNAIKIWEAGKTGNFFRPVSRSDGAITTVGYGTEAPAGTTMNEAQATQALINDLNQRANIVNNALNREGISLTQSQKEALISYTFNRGPGGLNELLKNSGKTWDSISSNLTKLWGTNQSASSGLINRRSWELEYANSNGTRGGDFNGAGSGTVAEGQNVLRTRVPDQYGSIDGNRTGAPMGFTSIPFVGSKVWVFFNGGDIQRPVYFAATYETQNIV